ncbi:SDR family NAD(P)-dependent oxidoreductase [Actinomadura flavalba]|uniref:SDR family NAD(P)-dependent oxidoreductase n=1 Tax=Actinomadura flavalba TaxID=1120938 RepID=UPI000371715C|nr:SDR family NAD(P)-dependent oxidoreductase [Actinomadura flavalba]
MDVLGGRVAVVTGAGSGIGRALALRLAAEGMSLGLADVEDAALTATAEAVAAAGAPVTARVTDVGDTASVAAFADEVFAAFGAVHLLCNNAGVFAGGRIWTLPPDDFDWVLRVNLGGVLNGVRAFVPRMIEQDTDGHVVNTASIAGLFPTPFTGPYTVSKHAVLAATETLAHDLALSGSRLGVSVLCPGGVRTRLTDSERNRPGEPAPRTDDRAFVRQVMDDAVTAGIDPGEVAAAVVAGVRNRTFLILTHPGHGPALAPRAADLAAGRLPDLPAL